MFKVKLAIFFAFLIGYDQSIGQTCNISNGTGQIGTGPGGNTFCRLVSCNPGYEVHDQFKNQCQVSLESAASQSVFSDSTSCYVQNGIGERVVGPGGNSFCKLVSCDSGYSVHEQFKNKCQLNSDSLNNEVVASPVATPLPVNSGELPNSIHFQVIGSSYTYAGGTVGYGPKDQFHEMMAASKIIVNQTPTVLGGSATPEIWNLTRTFANPKVELRKGNKDILLLMGHMSEGILNTIINEADAMGTDVILYGVWNAISGPLVSITSRMHVPTYSVAKRQKVAYSPNGYAFLEAEKLLVKERGMTQTQALQYLRKDGLHANNRGAYLAACTVYLAYFGQLVPVKDYLPPEVSASDAYLFQRAAMTAFLNYGN